MAKFLFKGFPVCPLSPFADHPALAEANEIMVS